MKPEDVETMRPRAGWMGLNDKKLRELGIDFFKSKTEWMPQVLTYAHAHATARAIAAAVVSTQKSLKIKTGLSNC